jgi:hypothetical protein
MKWELTGPSDPLHLPETLTPKVLLILQMAAEGAGLDQDVLLKHHVSIFTKQGDFAVLVAYMLASLPNLRHLFIVFTEPGYWRTEQKAIQRMLEDSFEYEDPGCYSAEPRDTANLQCSASVHLRSSTPIKLTHPFRYQCCQWSRVWSPAGIYSPIHATQEYSISAHTRSTFL